MSEILGVLFKYLVALLGVAAVVGILYLVFGSNKTQTAISDVTLLQTNTQSLYNGSNTFTSLTNTIAITGKLAPQSMISGATLVNPWGGTVTVSVNASNAAQFDVAESASVPADACAQMIRGVATAIALKVNGTAQTLPLDPGSAVTACNLAANALTFTFGR